MAGRRKVTEWVLENLIHATSGGVRGDVNGEKGIRKGLNQAKESQVDRLKFEFHRYREWQK